MKIIILAMLLLQGCATSSAIRNLITGEQFDDPKVEISKYLHREENKLLPPAGGQIPIAVYGFQDKTGQRKEIPNIASLSSAVTQGGENYLIKALQDVGYGQWFKVLERVNVDNLIKERQMIRQAREQFEGRDAKQLPAMTFAGIIADGAIVGYDTNNVTGGAGVGVFGISGSTQYQADTVTISLRVISVSSGEVLTSVTVTKTVLSYVDKFGVMKFFDTGTNAFEAELGGSLNESIGRATNKAIQAAVVETIREGVKKGYWSFKEQPHEKVNTTVVN